MLSGVLEDKAYHRIYETLFQAVISEKASYISAKKVTKATALARLAACADAVCVVVKAGTPKLKVKTIEAIVDHITQTLPASDDEYCQPLAQYYLKALRIVFEYSPNVERLKKSTWIEVVDFCVHGLNQHLNGHDGQSSGSIRSFSGSGPGLSSNSMAKSSTPISNPQKRTSSTSRQNVQDILQTLCLLVSTPNAAIADKYHIVIDTVIRLLQTLGNSVSQLHQLAFSIVNVVLSHTCMDQVSFSQSVARNIIPVICRFWQGKIVAQDEMLNLVRDEMLIFLFTIQLHIEKGLRSEENGEILTRLEELSDTLVSDYSRRSDRDQLQLDDLEMINLGIEMSKTPPFSLNIYRLRAHNSRAERNWGVLQAISILERLIILGHRKGQPTAGIVDKLESDITPRKRRRLTQSSDRLISFLKSGNERTQISALQALPFIIQGCQLSASELEEVMDQLRSCASDKRGNISSWALLAIARFVVQGLDPEVND